MANGSSRVQVAEPNYRLIEENITESFTPQGDLLQQMHELVARDRFTAKIRFGCVVTSARTVDAAGRETLDDTAAAGVRVSFIANSAGNAKQHSTVLAKDHVLFCTGGLQTPRDVQLPGEHEFGGDVILGINSQVDHTLLEGRRVAVLGMGAFAVENARTALLRGATHVTMVARHYGLVLPRLLVGLGTIQAGADALFRSGGNTAALRGGGGSGTAAAAAAAAASAAVADDKGSEQSQQGAAVAQLHATLSLCVWSCLFERAPLTRFNVPLSLCVCMCVCVCVRAVFEQQQLLPPPHPLATRWCNCWPLHTHLLVRSK